MLITLCDESVHWVVNIRMDSSVTEYFYTEHCSVWFYQLIDYYYGQEEDDARKRMTEKGFLRWPDGAIRKILFIYLFIFY